MNMKKKMVLLLGVAALVVGLGLSAIAWAIGGPDGISTEHISVYQETFDAAGVHGLQIQSENASVILRPAEGDRIEVEYTQSEQSRVTFETRDGVLYITEKTDWRRSWFDLNFTFDARYIDISLPPDLLDALTVTSTNGDLYFSRMQVTDSARLETANGDICAVACTFDALDVTSTNGEIRMGNLTVANRLQTRTTNGDAVLADLATGELICSSVNGDIALTGCEAEISVSCSTTNGDISANRLCTASCRVDSVNGEIDFELVGRATDYSISTDSVNGDIRCPEGNGGADQRINVSTVNGDVRITFTE